MINNKNIVYENFRNVMSKNMNSNVLLAFSGGADSFCALLCLMRYIQSKKFICNVHVVMVQDSKYNSSNDAFLEWIKNYTKENKNFYFHIVKSTYLDSGEPELNFEESYREERLAIIKRISKEQKCKIVITGHNANDRAETVFKRLLESSSLYKAYGMSERDEKHDLVIIRPLIDVKKKDIVAFAKGFKCPYEAHNFDARSSRDRIRSEILPIITKRFGKEVILPLCRISKQSKMLESYFHEKLSPIFQQLEIKESKCFIPQRIVSSLQDLEISFLIRKLCEKWGLSISFDALTDIAKIAKNKRGRKLVSFHKGFIISDSKGLHIDYKES